MFKTQKVYIQVARNKITAINLETGEQVITPAEQPFSSKRHVLGSFQNADAAIKQALSDLGIKAKFASLKVVMQQTEEADGGLADIEKRAMRDLGEMAGAKAVYVVDREEPVSIDDALRVIDEGR